MADSRFERYLAPARAGAALWRLALGLILIATVYLGLSLGLAILYTQLLGRLPGDAARGQSPQGVLLMLFSFLPLILGALLAVRLLHHRDGWTLMGAGWAMDFLRAALLLGLLHAAALALWHLDGGRTQPNLDLALWALLLPLAIVATLIQTLAEEILFRGYLLQQLAVRFATPALWFVLPALLFGAAHSQPALFGAAWIFPVIAATVFGLIAADLTLRRGNLGMAWGLHFATNLFALTVVATGPVMTGLALRLSGHQISALTTHPWLLLADLAPLLIAWGLLRRACPA